jgi:4-amino-4-deoxy-L-arabinose transferase-like glycosyltransferase
MTFFISPEIAYILIAILFFSSVYIAYRNLYKAFIIMMFFVPLMHKELFSLVLWDLLPIRVFLIGLGLVLAAKLFIHVKKNGFDLVLKEYLHDPFFIILTALWIFRVISIYNSAEPLRSFFFLSFFLLTILLYASYKYVIKLNPENFNGILKYYLFIGFLTEIFAIVQYYLRLCCRETVGGVWVIPGFTPRLGSSFWDVNHYGAFLITLIPLIFNFLISSKQIKYRLMYGSYLILSLWLLFMTQSRSAWIGLFIGSLITFGIYFWNMLKKPLLIGFLGLIFSLIAGISAIQILNIDVKSKIANYMHHRLDSTDTHFMLLTAASEIFYNNFFFGAGYGSFDSAFRQTDTAVDYFDKEPKLKEAQVLPHSNWGEVLGEGGAVGITLYTAFMIFVLAALIYSIKSERSNSKKYAGIGLMGGFIGLLSSGLFYSYNMEFFWLFIFMAIGYVFVVNDFELNITHLIKWWSRLGIAPYLIIVPVAAFFIYINLGQNSLIDYDEAIYAKVAKNIVLTNDWITLTWKDFDKPWFEKPPLYMWISAVLFKIIGFGEFGARFASAFFGLGGIIVVYNFGRKLYNKTVGLISAIIMISVIHYMYYARNGMLDVTVTFFIVSSLFAFYNAFVSKNDNAKYLYLISGLLIGLGVMTKSVIGFLPLGIIFIYILVNKLFVSRSSRIPYLGLFFIFIGLMITAAPWHIYSYIVHGEEFIDEYLIEHVFERGTSGLGHKEPFLWYLEVIKVSFRIWVLALIPGLLALPIFDKKYRKQFLFTFISAIFIFCFFTASEDKLQWYIMPIYPFLAILAGRFIERFFVVLNDAIKKDFSLDPYLLRSILIICTLLVSFFYFIWNKDKVYYPDFNKDKVALIKIFNEKYPVEDYPNRRLYYYKISEPILLFYSDQQIKSANFDDIVRKIGDADINETFSFLTPSDTFYRVRTLHPLDIQGSAGNWILYRSISVVEFEQIKLVNLNKELSSLFSKKVDPKMVFTTIDEARILEIMNKEIPATIQKLIDYGYPPKTTTTQ